MHLLDFDKKSGYFLFLLNLCTACKKLNIYFGPIDCLCKSQTILQ